MHSYADRSPDANGNSSATSRKTTVEKYARSCGHYGHEASNRVHDFAQFTREKRGEALTRLIRAVEDLDDDIWGGAGGALSMEQDVELYDIWIEPNWPIQYSDAEILAMADSIGTKGVLEPLILTRCPEPEPGDAHFLVVDGRLRFKGALRAGKTRVPAIVRKFESFFDMYEASVRSKTSQRPATARERAQLLQQLRMVHAREEKDFRERGLDYPAWPSQEVLALWLGCSQAEISKDIQLVDQPLEIVEMLFAGQLTDGQALEVRVLPADDRVQLAREVAAEAAAGQVPSRERLRGAIRVRQGYRLSFPSGVEVPSQLWLRPPQQSSPDEAFGMFLHDFVEWVQAIQRVVARPEPLLRQFMRLAESPEIQAYLQEMVLLGPAEEGE